MPAILLAFCLIPFTLAARERALEGRGDRPASSRYAVLTAERVLSASDRESLAERGVRVVRSMGGRRYIVNLMSHAGDLAAEPSVAAVQEIRADQKVPASIRGRAQFRAFDLLKVSFQDDVDLGGAKDLLQRLGATPHRPLLTDFELPHAITAWVPRSRLDALAQAPEVLFVAGAHRAIKSMNANAALLSSITPLAAAPYNLNGSGVTVSLYDLGNVDAAHPEFGGRLTNKLVAGFLPHPTHVAGTLGAGGLNAAAKGMAPAATLLHFEVDLDFLERKRADFLSFPIAIDNNSWGFVYGWDFDFGKGKWVWYPNDLEFGSYDLFSSGIDRLIRDRNVPIFFAAGNDNTDGGPGFAPFVHLHLGSDDEIENINYCYPSASSGGGCPPAPECQVCEAIRHEPDGPYTSIGSTSSAKNAISVGSVNQNKQIAGYSSRGPAQDGRVKPDLVAKGEGTFSTGTGTSYNTMFGTSMATPVVTGAATLLTQQWRNIFGGGNPPPAVLKTLLVAGAEDLGPVGPDYTYGFGLVNAKASADFIREDNGTGSRIVRTSIAQGARLEIPLTVITPTNLRVVLGWSDPENLGGPLGESPSFALVNDLDVVLAGPGGVQTFPWALNPFSPELGASREVNRRDNTEVIDLPNAAPGSYRLIVSGASVPAGPQDFVLVANLALAAARPGCGDTYEPNDTAEAAYGRLRSGLTISARSCEAIDLDFYRFRADRSGPVEVTVTAGDTPIRLTLSSPGFFASVDVAARTTRSIQSSVGPGAGQPVTPVEFTVKVEPLGSVTGDGAYTLRPSFGTSVPNRRRAVR